MPVDDYTRLGVAMRKGLVTEVRGLEAKRAEKAERVQTRHFVIVRSGNDIRVSCRCGKVATLATQNINVFVRRFNEMLLDHEFCEAVGEAHATE